MEHLQLLLLELGQLSLKWNLFLLGWDKRSVGDMVKVWVWCVPPQGQCKGVVSVGWSALPYPPTEGELPLCVVDIHIGNC